MKNIIYLFLLLFPYICFAQYDFEEPEINCSCKINKAGIAELEFYINQDIDSKLILETDSDLFSDDLNMKFYLNDIEDSTWKYNNADRIVVDKQQVDEGIIIYKSVEGPFTTKLKVRLDDSLKKVTIEFWQFRLMDDHAIFNLPSIKDFHIALSNGNTIFLGYENVVLCLGKG